jgi:LPXTG-motif cell wall-anchored protein
VTGSSTWVMAGVGLALLVAGTVLAIVARRRLAT